MPKNIIVDKKIIFGTISLLGHFVLVYWFVPYTEKFSLNLFSNGTNKAIAPAPKEVGIVPSDPDLLSGVDKKAYDELSNWVSVSVGNQPALSRNPQTVKLPATWTAREDYLSAVLPSKMPDKLLKYRGIIMRPPQSKSMSRDDAIFTVFDISDPYFKDHCHQGTSGGDSTCYSGKNPDTKHVFDLMFHFQTLK